MRDFLYNSLRSTLFLQNCTIPPRSKPVFPRRPNFNLSTILPHSVDLLVSLPVLQVKMCLIHHILLRYWGHEKVFEREMRITIRTHDASSVPVIPPSKPLPAHGLWAWRDCHGISFGTPASSRALSASGGNSGRGGSVDRRSTQSVVFLFDQRSAPT